MFQISQTTWNKQCELILISAWWTDLLQLASKSVTTYAFYMMCSSNVEFCEIKRKNSAHTICKQDAVDLVWLRLRENIASFKCHIGLEIGLIFLFYFRFALRKCSHSLRSISDSFRSISDHIWAFTSRLLLTSINLNCLLVCNNHEIYLDGVIVQYGFEM